MEAQPTSSQGGTREGGIERTARGPPAPTNDAAAGPQSATPPGCPGSRLRLGLCPDCASCQGPFALLKEQRPHLGSGSRRWCRAALGEADRPDDAGGRTPRGWQPGGQAARGSGRPGRGVARPAPSPTRSRPYSLEAAEFKCGRKWGGPGGRIFKVLLHPGAPPRESAESPSGSGLGRGVGVVKPGGGAHRLSAAVHLACCAVVLQEAPTLSTRPPLPASSPHLNTASSGPPEGQD